MSWKISLKEIPTPANPLALADVTPLLERLEHAFGCGPLARLLDTDPSIVSSWSSGQQRMNREMERRVIDIHDVLMRAFQVLDPDTAMRWLVGSEPFLGGRRPIDVLALRGAAPLIEAIDNMESGAYA
jgi:hypothetical protein